MRRIIFFIIYPLLLGVHYILLGVYYIGEFIEKIFKKNKEV